MTTRAAPADVPIPVAALARSVRFARAERAHARLSYLTALKRGSSSAHLAMLRGRWQACDDAAALMDCLLTHLPRDARADVEAQAAEE